MISTVFLSHVLSPQAPGFGGAKDFSILQMSSIAEGKSSNSQKWTLPNHLGTHIDVPKHFIDSGESIETFSASAWFFSNPFMVSLETKENELINAGDWLQKVPSNCDLLLLRTHFEKFRSEVKYWQNNPGLHPDLADALRVKLPKLRAIGFDFISATAFQHREIGRTAHRAFLGHPERPLLIIEDMALEKVRSHLKKVIVSPLRVEGSDGSPVTVFADVEGEW